MWPGLQGQGLGSALLDYAETLYRETRADVSNFRPNIIQFYQNRGYRSARVVSCKYLLSTLKGLTRK